MFAFNYGFHKNEINYSRKTIIQASDLKAKLESMNIIAIHRIISIDAVKMYPFVNFLGIHLFPTIMVFASMLPLFYIFSDANPSKIIFEVSVFEL